MPWSDAEKAECERILDWGMSEDLGEAGDLTSNLVLDAGAVGAALITPRQPGIVAGLEALAILSRKQGGGVTIEQFADDGPVAAQTPVARLQGPLRSLFAIERLALNFLSRLSGVATLAARFVNFVAHTKAVICDTRKTTPGWRRLEKYAVRVGGGVNQRTGLFDAVLIKDNHLASLARKHRQPIAVAVERARSGPAGVLVQVEVDSLTQFESALVAAPDMILLDNMTTEMLGIAVEIRNMKAPTILLEASGGITLANVAEIANTGIDRISVGALTHSAVALDLGLDYEPDG
jgi:nicotinate-nucleotide pyrophosphorylase (carboxylating)